MIQYTIGDATRPQGEGQKVIVHVCNDVGAWGKGFVLALSKRWPQPEAGYKAWFRGEGEQPFELGRVQFVRVEDDISVANLIGQKGLHPRKKIPPVRYEAIKEGLEKVADYCRKNNASIHMPRIGSGLAGGSWDKVEKIIRDTLIKCSISTSVYDLPSKQV